MSSANGDESAGAARLGRILLVDDQAQNRDMLGRRLERRGYEVILRESAVGVENTIADEKIELVLLDWMMPERSGLEALQGIRARFDAEHVPVIVVTALDDGDIVSTALEAGANDYIPKPIDLRVLTARVKAQLDRREAVLALDCIRNDLEKTVFERTQDLRSANETPSAEITEREAAEARRSDCREEARQEAGRRGRGQEVAPQASAGREIRSHTRRNGGGCVLSGSHGEAPRKRPCQSSTYS